MDVNYTLTKENNMVDTISELYESIHQIICIHCKLNKLAMVITHNLNYNGFKRWHRCRARKFFELDLKLRNELLDKFRIKADFKDYDVTYSPSNIEEHIKLWDKSLLDAIEELGTLSKKYNDETGTVCAVIDCALCELVKDYEKVGRLIKRFNDSDWLTLDIHIVDDKIHKKYKKKEMKHGLRY